MYLYFQYSYLPFQIKKGHIGEPAKLWTGIFVLINACIPWYEYVIHLVLKAISMSVKNLYRQAGFVAAVFYTTVKNKFVGVIGDYNFAS
jgi:hypothetical protein